MLSLKERFIKIFYHTECPSEKPREIVRHSKSKRPIHPANDESRAGQRTSGNAAIRLPPIYSSSPKNSTYPKQTPTKLLYLLRSGLFLPRVRRLLFTSSILIIGNREAQSLAQAKHDVDAMDMQASLTEERIKHHIRRKSLNRPSIPPAPASEDYRPLRKELGSAGSTVSSID